MIIFLPRKGEERREQRKLHNEVPQNLYSLPYIVIIKNDAISGKFMKNFELKESIEEIILELETGVGG